MTKIAAILAVVGAAGAANAGFSLSGAGPFDSVGALGNAGNFSQVFGGVIGNHLIGGVRIRGSLTEVNVSTFAREARWNVANLSAAYNNSYQVFTQTSFTGTIDGDRTFGVLQWWNNGDQLRLEAFESIDDGSGIDAQWTNVSFDFIDATVNDLGTFASGSTFDFDTFTSGFDTELALYTASGVLLSENDDTGGLQSRINAGALADGSYYLVVGGYNSAFSDYSAAGGTASGNLNLQLNGQTINTGAFAAGELRVFAFNVPTPGALALMGMGAVVAGRRRR